MKLFCFPRSGNSREVKIVLAEKAIPFEPVNVHDAAFDRENEDFKKASPKGKVPAIIDGEVYLSEAAAINEYLEEKYPQNPVLPKDPAERQKIKDWITLSDKRLVLKIGLLVIECLLKKKEEQKEETKVRLRGEIADALRELDTLLAGKQYLFGDFSLADASVIPHIAALPILGTSIPADYRHLLAWFERVKARPSFQKSAA